MQPRLLIRAAIGIAYIFMGAAVLYSLKDLLWTLFGALLIIYGAFRLYRAIKMDV